MAPRTIAEHGPAQRSQDKHSKALWTSLSSMAGLPARLPPAASHGFQPWPQTRFTAAVGAGSTGGRTDLILALALAPLQWLMLVQRGVNGGRVWTAQDPSSSHLAFLSLGSLFL